MELYLIRHGETIWNVENRILGRTDIPLNEQGIRQAERTGEILAEVPLDRIYSSPLSRAVDTAQKVADRQRTCPRVCPDDRLIECDFGIYEGADRGDPAYQADKRRYFVRYPGGESFFDVAARVYPFLYELRENAGSKEKVLIATHNGICRVIANFFEPMENEEFTTFTMGNCEVRRYEL